MKFLLLVALGFVAASAGSEAGTERLFGTDVSALDAEVLRVAVADFASRTEHFRPKVSDEPVLVDATTLQADFKISDAQVRDEVGQEEWPALAPLMSSLR